MFQIQSSNNKHIVIVFSYTGGVIKVGIYNFLHFLRWSLSYFLNALREQERDGFNSPQFLGIYRSGSSLAEGSSCGLF